MGWSEVGSALAKTRASFDVGAFCVRHGRQKKKMQCVVLLSCALCFLFPVALVVVVFFLLVSSLLSCSRDCMRSLLPAGFCVLLSVLYCLFRSLKYPTKQHTLRVTTDDEWAKIALGQAKGPTPECGKGNVAEVVSTVAEESGLSKRQVPLRSTPPASRQREDLLRILSCSVECGSFQFVFFVFVSRFPDGVHSG